LAAPSLATRWKDLKPLKPKLSKPAPHSKSYENRLTGYNVVYEFAGKQYNVQLPKDPGPTIKLQITPVL